MEDLSDDEDYVDDPYPFGLNQRQQHLDGDAETGPATTVLDSLEDAAEVATITAAAAADDDDDDDDDESCLSMHVQGAAIESHDDENIDENSNYHTARAVEDNDGRVIMFSAGRDASVARDQARSGGSASDGGSFGSWDIVERAGYLASAPVSSPLILLAQMAHLCTRSETSPFAAVTALGHSQGAAAAIVAAMACDSDGNATSFSSGSTSASVSTSLESSSTRYTQAAGRYARCLLWSGVRTQAAIMHAIALQQPETITTATSSCTLPSTSSSSSLSSSRRDLPPVCMIAVSGVSLEQLRVIIADVNATLPTAALLSISLQNARESFVVGGTPLGLFALRRAIAARDRPVVEAAPGSGCHTGDNAGDTFAVNITPRSLRVQGIAATVPFHDPAYLADAGEATLADLIQRRLIAVAGSVAAPSPAPTPAAPSAPFSFVASSSCSSTRDNGDAVPLSAPMVVSPVDGRNMRLSVNDPSQTMEAFVRMLTCLPVVWPESVASASILTTACKFKDTSHCSTAENVCASSARLTMRQPMDFPPSPPRRCCVLLKHFGPRGGKGMTLRTLRDEEDRLGALGITVTTDTDSVECVDDVVEDGVQFDIRAQDVVDINATAFSAAAAAATTTAATADDVTEQQRLYANVLDLILSIVAEVSISSTSATESSPPSPSVVIDKDTPLVSAAGLNSSQALSVAALLRQKLGPALGKGLSDLLLFDFPTAGDVAAHVCASVQTVPRCYSRAGSSRYGAGRKESESSWSEVDNGLESSFGVQSIASGIGYCNRLSLRGHLSAEGSVNQTDIAITATASRRGYGVDVPYCDGVNPLMATRSIGEDERVCEMASAFGSLLPSVDSFDSELFSAHPSEAGVMDPQQRLLL